MAEADLSTLFQHWEKMADLQIKFIETLGKHKLDVAKSELVAAVAAGEMAVAQMKARVAQELEAALNRMNVVRYQSQQRIRRIRTAAAQAAMIRRGEQLDADLVPQVWVGLAFFQLLVPQATLDAIADTPLEPATRKGSAYCCNRDPSVACSDVPDTVENALMLLPWLKTKKYMPRIGTRAYRQVTAAFSTIAGVAAAETAKLETMLADMEAGTYKTWNPLAIAALPQSIDVKRIVEAGIGG